MSDCLFCRIERKEIPSRIVYEDGEALAFEDVNPQAPVHVLIIPRRHIRSISDLEPSEQLLAGRLLIIAKRIAAEKNLTDSGYRIVTNTGLQAGQSVPHLHFHLLGGRGMGWPPG